MRVPFSFAVDFKFERPDLIQVSLRTIRPWTNGSDWETHETLHSAAQLRYNYKRGYWEVCNTHRTLNHKFITWLEELVRCPECCYKFAGWFANCYNQLTGSRTKRDVYAGYFVP